MLYAKSEKVQKSGILFLIQYISTLEFLINEILSIFDLYIVKTYNKTHIIGKKYNKIVRSFISGE